MHSLLLASECERLFFTLLDDIAKKKPLEHLEARLSKVRKEQSTFFNWLNWYGQKILQPGVTILNPSLGRLMQSFDRTRSLSMFVQAVKEDLATYSSKATISIFNGENSTFRGTELENSYAFSQVESYFTAAHEYYSQNRLEETIKICDEALDIQPALTDILLLKGLALAKLGFFLDSTRPFENALVAHAKSHEILFVRGVVLSYSGRYAESTLSLSASISAKPDFHGALLMHGVNLAFLGYTKEAVQSWQKALSVKPNCEQSLFNIGLALDVLGRLEEAISAYDTALSITPNNQKLFYNRGNSLLKLCRYREALDMYNAALIGDRKNSKYLCAKSLTLLYLDRYAEAITTCNEALEIDSNCYEALHSKGNALSRLGKYEAAIQSFDQAIGIKRDDDFVWRNRGIAVRNSLESAALTISPSQHESLNQRGYEGEIACYKLGLKYVMQHEKPEGWGLLHRAIGRAHYAKGCFLHNASVYLAKAIAAYDKSLATLTAFPKSHLAVLQDAIRAYFGLGNLEMVSQCREQGAEIFRQLLNEAPTSSAKRRLEVEFSGFSQLQVDTFTKAKRYTTALTTAERHKNRTLTWLLDTWQEQAVSPSWANIQNLLTPNTAILYWHLSPDALTTFLLTAEAGEPITYTQSTRMLEPWIKKWNRQYEAYRGKDKAVEANKDVDVWRTSLRSSLAELKEILQISELETNLQNASRLLLIPHRDLHRLPLHALFSDTFTISHLPSLKVGLNLKDRPSAATQRHKMPLLTLANPRSSSTQRLEYAETEAALIGLLFEQVDAIKSQDAIAQTLTAKLSEPNRIFNFSGHAEAKKQPQHSALYLKENEEESENKQERLTAEAICQLNLSSYDLVTLSACETAITELQTIESDYVGLSSAFLTAGAAHVVSTLWTVESKSNAWLMVKFYQHYVEGDAPAHSLRKAQHWLLNLTNAELVEWLRMQRDRLSEQTQHDTCDALDDVISDLQEDPSKLNSKPYADPYYWAAFTVTGTFA